MPTTVNLETAADFAILAGTTITNVGATAITGGVNGNVGLSPGLLAAITGFPPGTVAAPGALHAADTDGLAAAAQIDLTAAYNQAAALTPTLDLSGQVLGDGGVVPTLGPGVYSFSAGAALTGQLILNGVGDYVFQITSTLVTSPASSIILIGGAAANRIYWQVGSSATIDTTTSFKGSILALTSITVNAGASIEGRALARNGAVTLDEVSIAAPGEAGEGICSDLVINYTPHYTGNHRICYRLADQSPGEVYCCMTDSTVSTPGVPKSFSFTITSTPCGTIPSPDPESCINQVYEGYIQPSCVDESSSENQVPWSITFNPDPSCVNNNVCCQATTPLITGYFNLTNAGSGYDDLLSPLTVTVVRDVSDPVAPGGGNDAIVNATITGGVITAVAVGATGGLYGKIPTFIIPAPTLPGPVTATMEAAIPCEGGTKYFEDCDGNAQSTILGLGQCAVFCFPKGTPFLYDAADLITPDTANYAYTSGGCCNCTTCRNYTVTMNNADTAGLLQVKYTRCTTPLSSPPQDSDFETVNMENGVPVNISCVVPNSIFVPDHSEATFDIVDNGECTDCIS